MTTRRSTPRAALDRLKKAFQKELGLSASTATDLLGSAVMYDKAYELSCLIALMKSLHSQNSSRRFVLQCGTSLTFRSKGGRINRGRWPYIAVIENDVVVGEIWLNIEFTALSAFSQGQTVIHPPYAMAHELDILLVRPGTAGWPTPKNILLGVEAKHRRFNKALLKELLGVRREMCLLSNTRASANRFAWWAKRGNLPSNPGSGLILYCSGSNVTRYDTAASFWGIRMEWKPT